MSESTRRIDDAPSAAAGESAGKVLLVDDDAGSRTATREFLTSLGYAVIESASPSPTTSTTGSTKRALDGRPAGSDPAALTHHPLRLRS